MCTLLLKTEEHKNKRGIECSDVCSIELDKHMLIQCCASAMLGVLLYFCREEQKEVGVYDFLKTEEHKNKSYDIELY